MASASLDDLKGLVAIAREGSFTRAAAKLGISQPALSQTIRNLEQRLGIRLLTRTTRSVSPTDAGLRLLETIAPHLDGIEAELVAIGDLRKKLSGNIRITTSEHPAQKILWPVLASALKGHPDIKVEVIIDYGLTDIVAERFDAGIRLGEQVAKDMIAVRIGPDLRMAVVGSPKYFKNRRTPKAPQDLTDHDCITFRQPTKGGLYAWEFEKHGRKIKVRVAGQFTFNNTSLPLAAALSGCGLAYLFEDQVESLVAKGKLIRVLSDWCEPFSGYHLYYPSRRQHTPAFAYLIDALRSRT